jgi:hypothetical protein
VDRFRSRTPSRMGTRKHCASVEVQLRLLPKNPSAMTELPDVIKSAGGDQYKLKAALQATADLMNDAREQNARFSFSSQAVSETGNAILASAIVEIWSIFCAESLRRIAGSRPSSRMA